MKLCKDCRWFWAPARIAMEGEFECRNPKNRQEDPVFGIMKAWSPSWLRSPQGAGRCGPEGTWFEEKKALPVTATGKGPFRPGEC
jgi:hypothetical protein